MKKVLLTALFSLLTLTASAKTYYIDGKKYVLDEQQIERLSMARCKSHGFTRKECIEIFIQVAMDKSAKINDIVVVSWIDDE